MSDTPRTDEWIGAACEYHETAAVVSDAFARQLERELTAALARAEKVEALNAALNAMWAEAFPETMVCSTRHHSIAVARDSIKSLRAKVSDLENRLAAKKGPAV